MRRLPRVYSDGPHVKEDPPEPEPKFVTTPLPSRRTPEEILALRESAAGHLFHEIGSDDFHRGVLATINWLVAANPKREDPYR